VVWQAGELVALSGAHALLAAAAGPLVLLVQHLGLQVGGQQGGELEHFAAATTPALVLVSVRDVERYVQERRICNATVATRRALQNIYQG
jgi:hypothetical protein